MSLSESGTRYIISFLPFWRLVYLSLKFGYVPKYLWFPGEGSDLSCLKMGSMAALRGHALLEEPTLPKPGQFSARYFPHVAPFGYFCQLVKSCFRAPHGLSCA